MELLWAGQMRQNLKWFYSDEDEVYLLADYHEGDLKFGL